MAAAPSDDMLFLAILVMTGAFVGASVSGALLETWLLNRERP
jgi:hypothetical protein